MITSLAVTLASFSLAISSQRTVATITYQKGNNLNTYQVKWQKNKHGKK